MASSPLQVSNNKSLKNLELKECSKNLLNKAHHGTPKRRLSYNGNLSTNSTPIGCQVNVNSNDFTPNGHKQFKIDENSPQHQSDQNNSTPFIKRKCLSKEQAFGKLNNSPFLLSSSNLTNLTDCLQSPKQLNESFETLQLANQDTIARLPSRTGSSRYLSRRASYNSSLFSKHKSAPLTCLTQKFSNDSSDLLVNSHQPLNDISNHYNSNSVNAQLNKNLKLNEDISFSDEQKDDVTDLENLIFGSGAMVNQQAPAIIHQHQQIIKQSLEVDATCRNLIGDRSKQLILPVITSAKHQDLHCISPETLVDVLNNKYEDQIDEYVIIDSRYPYEFEGGHIRHALNIYTKDKLYEEMFIKRLNFKSNNVHKLPMSVSSSSLANQTNTSLHHSASTVSVSSMEPNENDLYSNPIELEQKHSKKIEKRVIIIFHCEFSSERGPSLLRFLRNQDRSLNEHIYPYLYYPELYLLEGGYKSFYENFKNYCDPQHYKPMLHAEHLNDLKHFRAKAKSWEVSRHNYFFKSSESLQRKQVLLNQMAKSAAAAAVTNTNQ